MRIAVVGSPQDVRGFALAGLPGRVAGSAADAAEALATEAGVGSGTALLLVSACVARLVPEALAAVQRREGGPAVLVLPEGPAL